MTKLPVLLGATLVTVISLALLSMHTRVAHAQSQPVATQWGTVTVYYTGWSQNAIQVSTTAPYVNPNNCYSTDQSYVTDPSNAGQQSQQATLLGAFLSGKKVLLWLQGCSYAMGNRAEIVGVGVQP